MKIKVYNIVFMQSYDDIEQLLNDLNIESLEDIDDNDLVNYLKQWEGSSISEHDSNIYSDDDLDTEFLGYCHNCDSDDNEGYLLSVNNSLNYCGLSYFKRIG